MKSIFDPKAKEEIIDRIHKLSENSHAQWGKMNAGQMLWHCQFPLKIAIKNENLGNGKFFMKLFKKTLYSDQPFKKKLPTDKRLIALEQKNFTSEKTELLDLIEQTHQLKNRIEWNPHPLFGTFTQEQWGILEYKHLDHHLTQFGV
ncbi:DUF1569 domain-containing protein [Aquimarina agarivorans]|uniref:DUF1569 domain-containing protein n=1 Tax=Aquimarina agarivorans TaxID=980584 RepID=UPI000248EB9B|nr:DUF1569 domain-containing protein [Aquimarina agarivorans]